MRYVGPRVVGARTQRSSNFGYVSRAKGCDYRVRPVGHLLVIGLAIALRRFGDFRCARGKKIGAVGLPNLPLPICRRSLEGRIDSFLPWSFDGPLDLAGRNDRVWLDREDSRSA